MEIHHTIRMMKTVEFMQIPLKLESTTDDVGIFMDIWFFLSQVIFDYLSRFYFGLHSCKQVCSRRRGNPSSTKALPSTLSDATGISLNLVGKKASIYFIIFFHGSEVRYAYTFTCIHRYAYFAILE